MSQLRHPNILLYMGSYYTNEKWSIVSEYMDNGSMYDVIHQKRTKLEYDQIIKMGKDIAIGMQYLHSRSIMHCDLKSSNILLDASFKIRITDFGNSKFKRKEEDDSFGRVGTPHWMAPEILRGEN